MKINLLTVFNVCVLFLFFPFQGLCQQTNTSDGFKITPVSPNTASLGLYGHTPVGHYTGIPNIDIPIYEIDLDGKKIPISISYHASGIRVAQEASSLGLGWTLNLGGCIAKSVNGEDDFIPSNNAFKSFYLDNINLSDLKSDLYSKDKTQINDKYWQYINSAGKGEPDTYYYNFAGFSGKMIFDKLGTNYKGFTNTTSSAKAILMSPKKYLDIVYNMAGGWIVKDLDGYTYGFEEVETATGYSLSSSGRLGQSDKDLRNLITNMQGTQTTAFYLTYIESPLKNRVTFQYEKETIYSPVSLSEQNYATSDPALFKFTRPYSGEQVQLSRKYYDVTYSYNRITQLRPTGVLFNGGSIEINASARQDLLSVANEVVPKKITSISIKNLSGTVIKSFLFDQSYRGRTAPADQDYLYKRLILNSITENTGAKHSFSYNSNDLPPKNSFETDFWGFYNMGQIEGNPMAFETIPTVNTTEGVLFGRNKRPKTELLDYMMLNKIQYPTGGKTSFHYEPHLLNQSFSYLENRVVYEGKSAAVFGPDYNDPCNTYGTTGKDVEQEFEVDNTTGAVNLSFRVTNNSGKPMFCGMSTSFSVWIEMLQGDKYVIVKAFNGSDGIYSFSATPSQLNFEKNYPGAFWPLSPGKYRLKIRIGVPGYTNFSVYAGIEYIKPTVVKETMIGGAGVRIQKLVDSIGSNAQTRKFTYSPAMLMYRPSFSTTQIVAPNYFTASSLPGYTFPDFSNIPSATYSISSTSSIVPFSNAAQGNIVGYSKVIEHIGENSELGHTDYFFENDPSRVLGAGADRYIPFFPTLENFLNGSVRSVTQFNQNDQIVQKDTFNYKTNMIKNIAAFKIYIPRPLQTIDGGFIGFYDLKVEESVLNNKTSTSYINGIPAQTINETYLYDPTYSLLTSLERTESQGKVKKQLTKYPFNYSDAISIGMINKNLKGIPLEKISLIDNNVIAASKTVYKDTLGTYLPSKTYSFKSNVPQILTAYSSYYKIDYTFTKYNSKGRLLEFLNPDKTFTSYLWDNLSLYPIAVIKNATYTQALTAFNGFDFSGIGIVNNSKELLARTNLPNSMVNTYTYKPLVGMTSKTDARGVTEYYEYDGMQRLKAVIDQFKHVTSSMDYHYRSN